MLNYDNNNKYRLDCLREYKNRFFPSKTNVVREVKNSLQISSKSRDDVLSY